jgi:hypothetical protein
MKKIRYSKSRLRVQIGEDGAGIVLEQIGQTLLECTNLRFYLRRLQWVIQRKGESVGKRQGGFICQ